MATQVNGAIAHAVEAPPKSLLDQIAEDDARERSKASSRYMPTLSVKQFTEREKQLRELKEMLMEGVDYGVIPGTDKPTLLLPGAQKICTFFGYVPHYEARQIEDWKGENTGGEPLFYYDFTCTLFKGADAVGEGRGSCNTWESKYRYRAAKRKCPSCAGEFIIAGKEEYGGGWLCFARKGGCGAKFKKGDAAIESQTLGRVSNPDFADVINTVQKIGQKRAYIAATLSATGASQYFTQDLEDVDREALGVDTGGHAVGTKAASDHVAQQKIAAASQATPPVATGSAQPNRGTPEQASGGSTSEESPELKTILANIAKPGGEWEFILRDLYESIKEVSTDDEARRAFEQGQTFHGVMTRSTAPALARYLYNRHQDLKKKAPANGELFNTKKDATYAND